MSHLLCDICRDSTREISSLIEVFILFRGRTCDEDSLWLGTIVLDLTIVLSDWFPQMTFVRGRNYDFGTIALVF